MADVSAILADARELEDTLQRSFVAFEKVVGRLLERGRLEGALICKLFCLAPTMDAHPNACTALNTESFTLFEHEIQTRFPRTAQQYIGSIHSALLSSFAASLPDAIPASKGELVGRLNECWRAVVLARPVLSELGMMSTGRVSTPPC